MSDERPTFGSLFAGIGGIDLGLERAGWRGRWQVEWDGFCQHVLAHHWPDVPRYGDITSVDWSTVEPVDLIAGGFPCQPISAAGKQLAQADDRWLWPEFERAVRYLRPRYVLVENVANLLAVNGGSAFGEVIGGLASLGYDAEWEVISAADVGAPHRRDRLWIVAYANEVGRAGGTGISGSSWRSEPADGRGALADDARLGRGWPRERALDGGPGGGGAVSLDAIGKTSNHVADAVGSGLEGHAGDGADRPEREKPDGSTGPVGVCDREDSGGWWATEPDVGRVAHGVPARVDRLRTLGNAVVPQIVEYLGRRILEEAEAVA